MIIHVCTVNHEYFIIKIFLDSMAYVKIEIRKNIRAILTIMWYSAVYPKII